MHPRRGPREVTLVGDREKVGELPQFDSSILSLSLMIAIGWTNAGLERRLQAMTNTHEDDNRAST